MRKWFLDMSIATRLGLGFGALVFLIVIFGLSALYQMNRLKHQSDNLYHHPFTVTRSVDAVVIEALKIHVEMKDLAHEVDRDKIRDHESRVSAYDEEALRNLETVKAQFLGDPQIVKQVHQLLIDWRPIRNEVIQLRLAGDLAAADAITRGRGAHHISLIENELKGLRLFAAQKASDYRHCCTDHAQHPYPAHPPRSRRGPGFARGSRATGGGYFAGRARTPHFDLQLHGSQYSRAD